MLLFLLGCTPECPECSEVPEGTVLAPWEADLLEEDLDDMRQGVRLYDEDSFGVCVGTRICDEYLSLDPGALEPGDHMIFAELRVPSIGDGWAVRFDADCQVTTTKGATTGYEHTRDYPLVYTGEKRGYRLSPLWRIQSPHPQGSRDCTFTLTPLRPDGELGEPISGSYVTAMPE